MASIIKRGDSYQVKVRLKGFPTRSASFKRLTDARKWATQEEAAIRERRRFKTIESEKHTFSELADRYIKDILPGKPKAEKKRTQQLNWWKEHIGSYVLADVTPALIGESRDKLLSTVNRFGHTNSPANVKRYLAALSHAFSVAAKEWGWIEDNPVLKVAKPIEPRGRVRFLSEDSEAPDGSVIEGERTQLLKACQESENPFLFPVVVLALSTGMRSGEIMNLHWSRPVQIPEGRTWGLVLLDRKAAILYDTKNKETRRVPLSGKALELLKAHAKVRRLDTTLLFPSKTNPRKPMDLRKPWLSALEAAEIEDFKFHDLRHSAASYLAMNGASLAEIAEILGHRTLQMVKRYAHLSEAHTAGVVERMNTAIFGEG